MNTFFGKTSSKSQILPFEPPIKDSFHTYLSDPFLNVSGTADTSTNFYEDNHYVLVLDGEINKIKKVTEPYHLTSNEKHKGTLQDLLKILRETDIHTLASRLLGAFALCIYDKTSKKLYLIRDVLGLKPLYYGIKDDMFLFASGFDHIHNYKLWGKPTLRPEIMKEVLSFGYMHAPNTVFKNIYQVETGQIVTWDTKNKSLSKEYFYRWHTQDSLKESEEKTGEALSELLLSVLADYTKKNPHTFTFLSGGIDSPLITAFAKKVSGNVTAFTFSIDDEQYNESLSATEYAKHFKIEQQIKSMTAKKLAAIIVEKINALTVPFGDFTNTPRYFISKAAK